LLNLANCSMEKNLRSQNLIIDHAMQSKFIYVDLLYDFFNRVLFRPRLPHTTPAISPQKSNMNI